MENNKLQKFFFIICLFFHSQVIAQMDGTLPDEVQWSDGKNTHTVYLHKQFVVEFPLTRTQEDKKEKNAFRIKKIQEGSLQSRALLSGEDPSNPNVAFSPMFSSKKNGAPDMALAPGIIVNFEENLSLDDIQEFLEEYSLELQNTEKLNLHQANAWMIKGPAGLKTLSIIKTLQEDTRVLWAMPNWWYHKKKK